MDSPGSQRLVWYTHGNCMFVLGFLSTSTGRWTIKPKDGFKRFEFWEYLNIIHNERYECFEV
jgi:hypothetical protein